MKKTIFFVITIFAVIAIVFSSKKASSPIVVDKTEIIATSTAQQNAPSTQALDSKNEQSSSAKVFGGISYIAPESSPSNYAPLPEKDYIKKRLFGNYVADTSAVYLPISNSFSWDDLGYKATLFVSETKEICHINELQIGKYTNANKVTYKIYGGSFVEKDVQPTMLSYQVTVKDACYNVGVLEEFKVIKNPETKENQILVKKRNAESDRVQTLLKKLMESVKITI